MPKLLFIFIVGAVLGCQSNAGRSPDRELSEQEALALAVNLANEQCEQTYGTRPFDLSTFQIVFREGRWRWGTLNVAGAYGFSAMVSFDRAGGEQRVEVFFSEDTPRFVPPSN